MRKSAGLLAVLVLLLQVGPALAQTSDYEIIEGFKKSRQTLLESIKAAREPGQISALDGEIGRLETGSAQHRALLAEGLYPETLDVAIAGLREQLKKSAERIAAAEESKKDKATIEVVTTEKEIAKREVVEVRRKNQEVQAVNDQLSVQVKELSGKIQKLSDENTGLLEKIKTLQSANKRDAESIAKLKELTDKLNANIRDRDELIVRMMDGMFGEYAKTGLTDVQRQNLFVNAQGNDYVGKIVSTLDGNVKYAESTVLTPQDLRMIQEEQKRLAAKWEGIKPAVAKLYPNEQVRTRDIATVDSRIADWKRGIDGATWRSIHQVFVDKGVDVGAFQSAAEFHDRLVAYLDAQIRKPSRAAYTAFKSKVWDSPIKDQWLPVVPTSDLTDRQRQDIEERIVLWDKAISAILLRWALIGAVAAILVVVSAVVVLRRKKPALPA